MVVQLWWRYAVKCAFASNLHKTSIWRWENRWFAAAFGTPLELFASNDIGVGSCMELLRQVRTVDLSYLFLAASKAWPHLCSRLGRHTHTSEPWKCRFSRPSPLVQQTYWTGYIVLPSQHRLSRQLYIYFFAHLVAFRKSR